MGGVNRLRGVGDTQQLQGLSVRLDGRGESCERSGRYTAATRFISMGESSDGRAATRFINET